MHPANVQDRDGAPTIAHLFADRGYADEKLENALRKLDGPTARMTQRASLLLPDAGTSNARWHGSTAADV